MSIGRATRSSFLLLGSLLLAGPLVAGPCIDCSTDGTIDFAFKDDHGLPGLPAGASAEPDVAADGDRFFVVFTNDAGGLNQVYLMVGQSLGCTWSPPIPVTSDPANPSGAPAIAVAGNCLDIVYQRGDIIRHRHADLSAFPNVTLGPEENLSDPAVSGPALNPDIASVSVGAETHVHVAWEGTPPTASTRHVMYKRSLLCGANGTFSLTESDLTNLAGPPDFATSTSTNPVLAADPAAGAPTESAVTVAFLNDNTTHNPLRSLYVLRSIDSGGRFYGEVAGAEPLPVKVDDLAGTAQPAAVLAAIDSAYAPGVGNWTVLAWGDDRKGANQGDTFLDAQLERGVTLTAAWRNDLAAEGGTGASRQPGVTAWQLAGEPARVFAYWVQNRMGNIPEIFTRRAILDPLVAPPASTVAFDCTLPGGGTSSRITGSFPQNRPGGNAQFPSVTDTLFNGQPVQLVAWVDTRNTTAEIWWKCTDPVAPAAPPTVTPTPTTCPDTGLDIAWTAAADCDVSRYVITVDDGTGPQTYNPAPPAMTYQVLGLKPSTSYNVTVRAVDEACNPGPGTTVAATTPPCITPVLRAATHPAPQDDCVAPPPNGHRDGQVEPNEIIRNVFLPIANVGTGPATGVSATIQPNIMVTLGNATSTYPDIPNGGSPASNNTPFSFRVQAAVPCGTNIDLNLLVTSNENPTGTTLTYRFSVPDQASGCEACNATVQLTAQQETFVDVCNGTGTGAGDGFPDPGETLLNVKLPVITSNTSVPCTNLTVVSLTSPTPGVIITRGTSAYPTPIDPGVQAENLTDFRVQLDPVAFVCPVSGPGVALDLVVTYEQRLTLQTLRYFIPTNDPTCGSCAAVGCNLNKATVQGHVPAATYTNDCDPPEPPRLPGPAWAPNVASDTDLADRWSGGPVGELALYQFDCPCVDTQYLAKNQLSGFLHIVY